MRQISDMIRFPSKYTASIELCYAWAHRALVTEHDDHIDRSEAVEAALENIHSELRDVMELMMERNMDRYDDELMGRGDE